MFAEHNGNVTHERHISDHTPNNLLLAIEVPPTARVELGIIGVVVVALGEKMERRFGSLVLSHNSVDDGDVFPDDIVHNNFADLRSRCRRVIEFQIPVP